MKNLKLISYRTLIVFTICVLLLFSCSCSCFAEQPQTVTMSIEQYQTLRNLLVEQDSQLGMLSGRIKMLKLTSPQLLEQLTKCQSELTQAREKLNQSLLNLQSSQESLNNAEKEIYALKLSLTRLESDIQAERSKVKRKSTQKAIYGVLGGFVVGKVVK